MSKEPIDIKDILFEALEKKDIKEQSAYLESVCGSNANLRIEVESLLKSHELASDFLPSPDLEPEINLKDFLLTVGPGTVIDKYKLLEKIGEGGMAVVYMAEQEKPIRRKVALKIIKLGMDTRSVIARFEAERQALALMDHPNIAKVLDAGATETGRPYFVMDLVPGLPITEYCDKNRLSIEERLRLFISVCNAIQHAHQKGIIHRDIKPSNIIVTQHDGQPVPKVIDFGIAKATNQRLTEKTLFTRHAHIIGTPAYMSPEQAELSDLDVDTRTDIYSLGILLYELLTGTTPFDEEQLRQAGYLKMQKIICEEEPTKPSTKLSTLGQALTDVARWHDCSPESMSRLVRGDLDWIVMKSLEKDRTRRYDTASALALDIQRHLNNKPVEAAAPSMSYKMRKFVRRHRIFVTAGLSFAALFLVVAVVSVMYAHERAIHAQESEDAKHKITGLLAGSYVDQAQALCEQGHVGRGMLWLAHSLEIAPEGSNNLKRAIRTSLASWYGRLHSLSSVVQYPGKIKKVAYSPDGSQILAACQDGTARLCDSTTGEPIGGPLRHGSNVVAVAISANSKRIATGGSDGSVRLWDATTLEPVGEQMQHGKGLVIAFSADSSQLITGGNDGAVRLWDANTGKSLGKLFQYEGETRWHSVRALASCPEGTRVVVTTGWSRHQMFDAETGEPIGPAITLSKTVFAVLISTDGKRFITGDGGGTIQVWDAVTGEQVQEPIAHGGTTYALAFSPDGSHIASAGASRMARLWDVATGSPIGGPMRQTNTVTTVGFSPDGTRIVTGNDGGVVQQWNLVLDRHVGKTVRPEGRICGARFGHNGLWVLTQIDEMVQFRNVTTGELIGKPFSGSKQIRLTTLSPDCSVLVTQRGPSAPELRLRNVTTGQMFGELYHPNPHCIVFSPDCTRIITGGEDNVARLWDTATSKCLTEFHQFQGVISDAAFSPDGSKFLIGSYDGTIRLWDSATLEQIGDLLIHQSEVKGLDYNHDGTKILIGFADGTVRLYDAATFKLIGTPLQHVQLVCSVAFSPDGSQLLACSIDGTARIWDAATLKPIGPPLEHDCGWPYSSFSPDGSEILLFGGRNGRIQVWQAPPAPLAGGCERISRWVQVITGMELDSAGGINVLDPHTWHQRFQRLQELGGPPEITLSKL